MKHYLGIDIGGTHIKGGVVDPLTYSIYQNIISHEELTVTDSTSSIITKIHKVIADIQTRTSLSELNGIGIAIPGPCDYSKGIVSIYGVPKFQSLFGLNLKEEIKKESHLNTLFINDASAYALGEYYAGAAKDANRSIIVTIGTGLGSTFLENDTVLNEQTEGIPEHGYLYNIPYQDGIADDYFSTRWFVNTWNTQFSNKKVSGVKEIALYALAGDRNAHSLFKKFASNFVEFITPFLQKFKPEKLIIGGNIAKASDFFLSNIQSQLEKLNLITKIDICKLWDISPLIGSAIHTSIILENMENIKEKRHTEQFIAPTNSTPTSSGEYDIYPAFPLGKSKIEKGINQLANWIEKHSQIKIDGYAGVFWDELIIKLGEELRRRGKNVRFFHASAAMKDPHTIEKMIAPYLGGDNPLFGTITDKNLMDWFDKNKLSAIQPDPEADLNIFIGIGAALSPWQAPLIYIDVPKNEIQFRMRAGVIYNLGLDYRKDNQQAYKQLYFVDWIVLNKHKKQYLPSINLLIDGQREWDELLMISGNDLREGLNKMSHNFFRVRPWFEPGAWGGQWMKNHIQGLNKEVANLAWSFELMVLENGLMFESDGYRLEVSFDFLMYSDYQNILGECAETFKYNFPIRFDFLDTFDGDNLSIQCHPRPRYIREHFNMPFTQDETYYILDCKNSPCVYLGFQDNIIPEKFQYALEESQQKAQKVDIEEFVQKHQAKKHDFFLIPNGTIHASGKDCLVLEISSAPYIFTFKMYDWIRLGLDGKPRPLNIQHGMNNLYFDRKGEKVVQELICHPCVMEENQECTIEHLSTHKEHFYDVYRYTIKNRIQMKTENKCHVCMVVEGDSIYVETEEGMKQRFNYAETFVIPAAAKSYTIINENPDKEVMLVKAFVKENVTLNPY